MAGDQKVKLEDVRFYFDGVVGDVLDSAALARRTAEWLQVRTKLIALDQDSYEVAMASIRSLVDSLVQAPPEKAEAQNWSESKEMYGQIRK